MTQKNIDRVIKMNSIGFLPKYMTNLSPKRADAIKEILDNDCSSINKFNNASKFNNMKNDITKQILKYIKATSIKRELENLIALYLIIISSCRPGYKDHHPSGIYSLKLKEIKLI